MPAQIVLPAIRKRQAGGTAYTEVAGKAFSVLMLSLSVIAGYMAFIFSGITQAYLINLAVGFLLLLCLERFFITWMKRIKDKKDTIEREQADIEEARDQGLWPPGGEPSAVVREGD
ncbi:MAG: hypothetical protein KIT80_15220 [Chitinophagaceae bacterium]|nr:hypothetical protein [Chitinophagaceae bacterium]MCW5928265.1 hypothetical protein [Chitinophagaceae bacterium]